MRSFLMCNAMPTDDVIQDSVVSSKSCVWTAFGVVQAATLSADASMRCLSEINDRWQKVRIAARHSLVGSNSVFSCSLWSRSDNKAHSSLIFSFRCSASVDAATACGFSRLRPSIHWRAACSLSAGIPRLASRWTLDFEQDNFRESSRCVT